MTIVMTLVAGDDEDVLDANLKFHLNTGVDLVIASVQGTNSATAEILRSYERDGGVRLIEEPGGKDPAGNWRTQGARLAATEYGADWVIDSDADEFWWPRGPSLAAILTNVPSTYGVVQAVVRHFVQVAEAEGPFYERMVYRLSPQAPITDPANPWRPGRRTVHRASPTVTVSGDDRVVDDAALRELRGWYPLEVLHFPMLSPAISEPTADPPALDEAATTVAMEQGVLARDVRLRDVLRTLDETPGPAAARSDLRLPTPSVVDDALFAVDIAVLGEADVYEARRSLDQIGARLGAVEAALPVRIELWLRSFLHRRRPGETAAEVDP